MARMSAAKLAAMCHRVGESYQAGIDLRSIWDREGKFGSTAYRRATEIVSEHVAAGQPLGDAMQQADGYFPDLTVAVATAGERSGRLEQAFRLLRDHYQTIVRFRNQVLISIAWPLFELGLSIIVIGLTILIMGYVTSLANAEPIDWLGLGLNTQQYFLLYCLFVTTVLGALGALILGTLKGWYGTTPMQLAARLPVIGAIIQKLALSRFAWALAIVTEAGINIKEGVRLALRATENFFYRDLEDQVSDDLQAGKDLTESLTATGRFPNEFLMYVDNAETSGQLPETLQKLADDYLEQVRNLFKLLSGILFFVCFITIAGVILIGIFLLFIKLIYEPRNEIMREIGYN